MKTDKEFKTFEEFQREYFPRQEEEEIDPEIFGEMVAWKAMKELYELLGKEYTKPKPEKPSKSMELDYIVQPLSKTQEIMIL